MPSSLPKALVQEAATNLKFRESILKALLDIREAELLQLKGPCSNESCDLHYEHRGPCDVRKT